MPPCAYCLMFPIFCLLGQGIHNGLGRVSNFKEREFGILVVALVARRQAAPASVRAQRMERPFWSAKVPSLGVLLNDGFVAARQTPPLVHPRHAGRIISNRSLVLQYQCGEAMRPMVKSFSVRTRFFSASNNSSRRWTRLIRPMMTRLPPICSVPHSTHSRLAGDSVMRGGFTTVDGVAC